MGAGGDRGAGHQRAEWAGETDYGEPSGAQGGADYTGEQHWGILLPAGRADAVSPLNRPDFKRLGAELLAGGVHGLQPPGHYGRHRGNKNGHRGGGGELR